MHKPTKSEVKHLLRKHVDVGLLVCTDAATWLHLDHIRKLLVEQELDLNVHPHGDVDWDLRLFVEVLLTLNAFNQDVVEMNELNEKAFSLH